MGEINWCVKDDQPEKKPAGEQGAGVHPDEAEQLTAELKAVKRKLTLVETKITLLERQIVEVKQSRNEFRAALEAERKKHRVG